MRVLDVVLDELASAPELSPEEAEASRQPAPRSGLFGTTAPAAPQADRSAAVTAPEPVPDPDDLVF